jgi:hypothetical protein
MPHVSLVEAKSPRERDKSPDLGGVALTQVAIASEIP